MTNAEKYKSDYDRFEGFNKFCNSHECITCPIITLGIKEPCKKVWLTLQVEEEETVKEHERKNNNEQ